MSGTVSTYVHRPPHHSHDRYTSCKLTMISQPFSVPRHYAYAYERC